MKTKSNKYILLLFLFLSFTFVFSTAEARERDGDVNSNGAYLAKKAGTGGITTYININGVASFFDWQGITGFNPNTGSSGTTYPRSKVGVIYRDGLVWGGLVRDGNTPVKRVGGNTYRIGTQPGKIVSGAPEDWEAQSAGNGVIRIYRIRADFKTINDAVLVADAADIFQISSSDVSQTEIDAIREQYALDWKEWPTDRNAPYYDTDDNGTYDPVLDGDGYAIPAGVDKDGNAIGGDYPGIANGDQVIWYVINDLNDGKTRDLYGSPPIGMEVESTIWGYNISTDLPLGNAFFKRYFVRNLSGADIDSMYFAQWSDPDLGDYSDDYVGNDPSKSLMYAYNGGVVDANFAQYGLAPGASGYDFLQGPIVDSPGDSAIFNLNRVYDKKNLSANAFSYFTAGGLPASDPTLGDYEGTLQWYNMLQGYLPTATDTPSASYTLPDGTPTFFPLAGKPWVSGETDIDGWVEGPADRRMSISTGPFNMAPGDVQEVVVGEIAALSISNLSSAQKLNYYDRAVQEAYDNFFDVPKPPTAPNVTATPLGSSILLDWGGNAAAVAATETNTPKYLFQGYNVYQYDPLGNAFKIATFDISDGVKAVFQDIFDDESGSILKKPAQIGTDSGIQRFFVVDKDYYTSKRLQPGREYVFAVTAYNYTQDLNALTATVENQLTEIRVVAQGPKPGDDYSNADAGDVIDVTRTGGSSDGGIDAVVINPADLANDTYTAEFTGLLSYTVTNSAGDTLLKDYENAAYADESAQEASDNAAAGLRKTSYSPAFHGVAVQGYGPPVGAKDWDYSGSRWISGTNWGGALLFGGGDVGANFFGSTVDPADTWLCHFEFQGPEALTDGYATKGVVYDRDAGYIYAGIGDIPFSAFDMTDPDNPRKVNILFTEDDNYATSNMTWDMGWDGSAFATQGAREYTFIMNSDYDATTGGGYDDTNWGPASDVVWAIWPSARGSHPNLEAQFTMDFIPYFPNKAGVDKFTFTTTAPTLNDKTLAKAQFEKATVWPNPYYAYNTQESSNFSRFVTISNLPAKVTVRIFNLAGTLVRTLEKSDATSQFLRWDLNNESGLPVASGLYVYYMDAPDLGQTKVLKGFIVQAKQKLRFY